MKREDKQMIFIYFLIFVIIVLLIVLTKVITSSVKKPEPVNESPSTVQETKINPYPTVNEECTFDVSLNDYNALTGLDVKVDILDII